MNGIDRFFLLFPIAFLFTINFSFAQEYQIQRLGPEVNTPFPEIAPVVSRDGKTVYFTRIGAPDFNRTLIERNQNLADSLTEPAYMQYLAEVYTQIAGYPVANPITSPFNQDIWIAGNLDEPAITSTHPGYPLNNALPNSVCSITPFDQTLVLINQFPDTGGMQRGYSLTSLQADDSWTHPQPITIDSYYNKQKEVNMTMSIDGSVIIFSMQQNDSYGQSDLYVSFREGETSWGAPQNLGPQVNTSYNETTPYLSDDTRTLYFASDRQHSMGNRDIYLIERLDDSWSSWSKPKRFVNPINSPADESHPCFNAATGMLYFTSKREGQPDIYRVQVAVPNPPYVMVKGAVVNRHNLSPVSARVVSGPASNPQVRNTFQAADGFFQIAIPKGEKIRLTAEKAGFLCEPIFFSFEHSYYYFKDYSVRLVLDPLEAGMRLELPSIYFEQSLPVIKPSSYPVVDELLLFLNENPDVHLKIEGHTDNQGNPADLMELSRQRANAIRTYLTQKGIEATRLETYGYGATVPVNDNSSEALREQNRRVEIFITKSGQQQKEPTVPSISR